MNREQANKEAEKALESMGYFIVTVVLIMLAVQIIFSDSKFLAYPFG